MNSRKILSTFAFVLCVWFSLCAWIVSSPVGSSPDEDFHITMIYCGTMSPSEKCSPNGARFRDCFSCRPNVSANCSTEKNSVNPTATQVGWDQYPSLYYKAISVFVGGDVGSTTMRVRVFNATFAVLLALASVFLTSPLFKLPVAISWLVSSVPLGIFILSSINPSSIVTVCTAAVWGPLLSLFTDGFSDKTGSVRFLRPRGISILRMLLVFALAAIAIGSRYEALIWVPFVCISLTIYWALGFGLSAKTFKVIGFAGAAIVISALAYFVLNDLTFDKIQRQFGGSWAHIFSNYFLNPTWKVFQQSVHSIIGTLALTGVPGSELGIHDIPAPPLASLFITIGFFGAALLGVAYMDFQKGVALACALGIFYLVVSFLWSTATWDIYQSRYFLPAIYMILGLSLLPVKGSVVIYNKCQWFLVFLSVSFGNCIMLLSTQLRYLYGVSFIETRYPLGKETPDMNPARLFGVEAPNWWLAPDYATPLIIWVLGSLSFLAAAMILWRLVTVSDRIQ